MSSVKSIKDDFQKVVMGQFCTTIIIKETNSLWPKWTVILNTSTRACISEINSANVLSLYRAAGWQQEVEFIIFPLYKHDLLLWKRLIELLHLKLKAVIFHPALSTAEQGKLFKLNCKQLKLPSCCDQSGK